ncbi:MAG: P1 family peptidase [Candidatus Melainabacteria bacterium]|nr:P1 family peptidase [Candidatus Melainabacteria bacterium]
MVLSLSGFRIGHYEDETALTGCTVLLFDEEALAAADVRGSAPATANFSTLDPIVRSARIDAIFLTGGSSFGLAAVAGVQKYLEKQKKGFDVGVTHIPNVPTAAIFDLAVGDSTVRPTAEMAEMACLLAVNTCDRDGTVGAGTGASVGKLLGIKQAMRGGFGFASGTTTGGATIWAFAVVNAFGDVWNQGRTEILAGCRTAPDKNDLADAGLMIREGAKRQGFGPTKKILEQESSVTNSGSETTGTASTSLEPSKEVREDQSRETVLSLENSAQTEQNKTGTVDNTTLIVMVTDAALDVISAKKLAQSGITGLTDVVYPACTIFDGDLAIAVSIGKIEEDLTQLCLIGQALVSEAIVNGVKAARPAAGLPAYEEPIWQQP